MRSAFAAFAIAVLGMLSPQIAAAQDRPVRLEALPQASRDVLSAWLQRDCSVGAEAGELARMRALPAGAQDALVEAYTQGPPPELDRTYQAAFVEAFDARSATIAREGARLFAADDVARLQTVDRDAYVNRRLEGARLNYRTNAVLGLGVIGARDALPLLNQIAGQPDNPMREAAVRSIAAVRDGQPPTQQSPR